MIMFSDFKVMHELQMQAVKKGVCPYCHTKTLTKPTEATPFFSEQCSNCHQIFMVGLEYEEGPNP